MKKIGTLLLALLVVMSFAACTRGNNMETTPTTESTAAPTTTTPTTAPTTMPATLPVTLPTMETNIPDPDTNEGLEDSETQNTTEGDTTGTRVS